MSKFVVTLALYLCGFGSQATVLAQMEWTQVNPGAPWPRRDCFSTGVFDNKFWVLGGGNDPTAYHDVWHTTDGINWTLATGAAAWSARWTHQSFVFQNRIWVAGGFDGYLRNDVWRSFDGQTWDLVTNSAGWSPRMCFAAGVLHDTIWVLGGFDGAQYKSDAWSSPDGVVWTQRRPQCEWSPRWGHAAVVWKDSIWIIGGLDGSGFLNDVWCSPDGVTWHRATASAAWHARSFHAALVLGGRLWVLGGADDPGDTRYWNDVWCSHDGRDWQCATTSAGWYPRCFFGSVPFKDTLWVYGGQTYGPTRLNDVWKSYVEDDVGAVRILTPVGTIDSGVVVTPQAVVQNFGSVPEVFQVRFQIGTTYVDTVSVTLNSGASDTVNFTQWVSVPGPHVTRCSTMLAGDQNPTNDFVTDSVTVGIEEAPENAATSQGFRVGTNPFRRSLSIRYEAPRDCEARLAVYNSAGALVRCLRYGIAEAGAHAAVWDGCDQKGRQVGPGAYFCRLAVDGCTGSIRIVKLE